MIPTSTRVLLVEPAYYTRYPPLGLLKLATWHREQNHEVALVRGKQLPSGPPPDVVEVTSLFTYAWKQVHDAVEHYRNAYPSAHIRLGGIYATLMPKHASLSGADGVHSGLIAEIEDLMPDYGLVPDWDASILFCSRGCIRKCPFCAVPKLEGAVTGHASVVADRVAKRHKRVILWDNNFLAVPYWKDVLDELTELDVEVDFNQGLDARLIDETVAKQLGRLRIRPVRLAYDSPGVGPAVKNAVECLSAVGFKRDKIVVYTLYNYRDTPEEFLGRVVDLLSWGVTCYPMRYEPLNSLTKNVYISAHWTSRRVEMVARARRVIGYGGAFPPYKGLLRKLDDATSFEEAFSLRPRPGEREFRDSKAGLVEPVTTGLTSDRERFRELLNDPCRVQQDTSCHLCKGTIPRGEVAFAQQDYAGRYVAYVCPACHPNQAWVHGLWRSTFPVVAEKYIAGNDEVFTLAGTHLVDLSP